MIKSAFTHYGYWLAESQLETFTSAFTMLQGDNECSCK